MHRKRTGYRTLSVSKIVAATYSGCEMYGEWLALIVWELMHRSAIRRCNSGLIARSFAQTMYRLAVRFHAASSTTPRPCPDACGTRRSTARAAAPGSQSS